LADPALELFDINNQSLGTNDNWRDHSQASLVEAAGFQPENDQESIIVATLEPGGYTVIISGSGGATGVGLIEVYEFP